MTERDGPPPRLAESPGPSGDLVRSVLSEQRASDPLPRFAQLQERRLARSWGRASALLVAAALCLVVGVRYLRPSEPALTVRAEPTSSALLIASAPVDSTVTKGAEPRELPSEAPVKKELPSKPRSALAGSPLPRAVSAPVPAAMPTPAELPGGAKACAELARSGAVEPAIGCYEGLARGSGVTAELALFEQARLAGKALRQPSRALALLDDYRQRFPSGSLRAEAMLAAIEWSLAAGDKARARAGVEEALASGLLEERRAELERLRTTLGDPAAH